MIIYVAHDLFDFEEASNTVRSLQSNDTENCYICPALALCSVVKDIGEGNITELCLDILQNSDKVIISDKSTGYLRKNELKLAELLGTEVVHLEGERPNRAIRTLSE